jgi:hypothetical protein
MQSDGRPAKGRDTRGRPQSGRLAGRPRWSHSERTVAWLWSSIYLNIPRFGRCVVFPGQAILSLQLDAFRERRSVGQSVYNAEGRSRRYKLSVIYVPAARDAAPPPPPPPQQQQPHVCVLGPSSASLPTVRPTVGLHS